MLDVRNLRRPGLEPVSFELPSGVLAAVTGPSGSGKTLLLRALADLDPSEGQISLDGVSRETVPAPVWRGRVLFVPAVPGWWAPTARTHFADGPPDAEALAALGLDAAKLDQPVTALSTGERQRLGLLRALARRPRVLLLDEPTSALDGESVSAVERLIGTFVAEGSVLMTTHDAEQADRLAMRRFGMVKGRFSAAGETA